jgi:hypothetical protein
MTLSTMPYGETRSAKRLNVRQSLPSSAGQLPTTCITTLDCLFAQGWCAGVLGEYDFWKNFGSDPPIGPAQSPQIVAPISLP